MSNNYEDIQKQEKNWSYHKAEYILFHLVNQKGVYRNF